MSYDAKTGVPVELTEDMLRVAGGSIPTGRPNLTATFRPGQGMEPPVARSTFPATEYDFEPKY